MKAINEENMTFGERYNEWCYTRGSLALRRLRDNYPGKNIRYILWQRKGEPQNYMLWIEKMWDKFFLETCPLMPVVTTPERHVDFDNWLVEQCEIKD